MDYARNLLQKEHEKLLKDHKNLQKMKEKLEKMPQSSMEESAKKVINTFLEGYEADVLSLEAKIESVGAAIKPISCRDDLSELTYVEIARFIKESDAMNYISGFEEEIDYHHDIVLAKTYAGSYKILVNSKFFNEYSAKIHEIHKILTQKGAFT